ncbi:hypothetical protein B0H10DRAFT_2336953 [Mycena sp. CBHHK59/15]|nr:hypothetical protein B0H10DRAFT_2336953 [Mycena sp. CBHHK59/15]
MVRDLAFATVFPRADYGVSSPRLHAVPCGTGKRCGDPPGTTASGRVPFRPVASTSVIARLRAANFEDVGATIDPTLGMDHIVAVYLPPWSDPLPVITIIPPKETAIDTSLNLVYGRIPPRWVSRRSGGAGGGWRAAGGYYDTSGRWSSGGRREQGILRGTENALSINSCHILMVSDSQAALNGIGSALTRSGFRAIECDKLVRGAVERLPDLCIANLWTPAHIGTVGNELADTTAKAATRLAPSLSNPVSLTTCKRAINVQILEEWNKMWSVAKTGRGLRELTVHHRH